MLEITGKIKYAEERAINDALSEFFNKFKLSKDQLVELMFVDEKKICELNIKYRHKNEVTDVLSFPQAKTPCKKNILGTVVICDNEKKMGNKHIIKLLNHGLLHLVGYDHVTDETKWNHAQRKLVSPINIRKLARSFHNAFRGVIRLLNDQQNARIHATATILVGIVAYLLGVSRVEATILFMAIVMVFAIEILNTAVEKLSDIIEPKESEVIAFVKDGMAGAVLISASIAVVVAILIFLPYIRELFV